MHIGDFVIFGGLSAIHQFGRVGSHAFVGGCAALNKDVPPYVMAAGNYAKPFRGQLRRPASSWLQRRGDLCRQARYKEIFRSGKTIEEVLPVLSEMAQSEPAIQLYVDFLKDNEARDHPCLIPFAGIVAGDLRRHPGRQGWCANCKPATRMRSSKGSPGRGCRLSA